MQELQQFLGAKLDQLYQPDQTEIVLALHKTGMGKHLLRIVPGTALYIASKKRASPQDQLNFCRFLRKRLDNTRLQEIIQKNKERIVEFHFAGKETKFILITEFFSKGNIILCDQNYTIISALQVQLWKDRKIKAKVMYEYPPEKKNIGEDFQEFAHLVEKSEKENIVKTLAMGLNLGGVYAEELCVRAQIDKNAKTLDDRELKRLFAQYQILSEEQVSPNIIDNNPVPFHMKSLGEGTAYKTYSEALDAYYSAFIPEEELKETEEKEDKNETILKDQERLRVQVEKAIEENQKKGEWIYAHYMEVRELLDLFKAGKKEEVKKKGAEIEGPNLLISIE